MNTFQSDGLSQSDSDTPFLIIISPSFHFGSGSKSIMITELIILRFPFTRLMSPHFEIVVISGPFVKGHLNSSLIIRNPLIIYIFKNIYNILEL